MLVIFYIFLIITSIYLFLIILFIVGFNNLKPVNINDTNLNTFSIIIPFRNEAEYILNILNSIEKLDYLKTCYEVILIDDESTDNSVEIINAFCLENPIIDIKLIENIRTSMSPKKDAIKTAISIAKYNWIITTDADCLLPVKWLLCFNTYINTYKPNMLVAPVCISNKNTFHTQYQSIDFLSMQGATIGSFGIKQPFLANGANLGYKKEIFKKLNGFKNNDFIASGDDVFLLENFINYKKEKVIFIKDYDALVTTYPTKTWQDLIAQRKRWAAKTTHFKSNNTKIIGVVVFLVNSITILTLIASILYPYFLLLLFSKFIVDGILIFKTATLYKQKIEFISYCKTLFFYPFFTIYIAIASLSSTFEWKKRTFNK
jgi:poly-beta-1,6-N-acetyl-D-glucosamine synthase